MQTKRLFRLYQEGGARKRIANDFILRKYKHPQKTRIVKRAALACMNFENSTKSKLVATSEIVKRIFQKERLKSALARKTPDQQKHWEKAIGCLIQLGNSSEGNKVDLYKRGDEYFKNLWNAIRHANEEILFECYILKKDQVSLRTVQELSAAARRGVQVKMVYDSVGASELPSNYKHELRSAGVDLREYNPVGIKSFLEGAPRRILFRNHKKSTVIDGKLAFVGGMNVTGEYCSKEIHGGIDRFRDTHAQIRGPAVQDIRKNFYDSLLDIYPQATADDLIEEAPGVSLRQSLCTRIYRIPRRMLVETGSKTKNSLDKLKTNMRKFRAIGTQVQPQMRNLTSNETGFANGTMVQVMQSWRASNCRPIQSAFHQALQTANRKVKITNPYFLPPPKIKKDILDAAKRGVDVQILTCSTSDVPVMAWASRHYYQDFLGSGVRIFEYKKKVLHSKTMIVDDLYSTFGSYNLDDWSYRRNLEMNIFMMDPEKARELNCHWEEDIVDSEEVTMDVLSQRGPLSRIWYFTAYQAARFPKRLEGGNLNSDACLSWASLSYPKKHPSLNV